MSNSKLVPFQKEARKTMLATLGDNGGKVFYFADYGITIAIEPVFKGSKTATVSVSTASENETKLRRKVGEFYALAKLYDDMYITVPLQPDCYESFADGLINLILDWK